MRVYAIVRYPLSSRLAFVLMMWAVENIKNGRTVPWDQSSVIKETSELSEDDRTESTQRTEDDNGFRSETDQMYAEVTEIVDCLYQLTASVHNPAPHDRYMSIKEVTDVSKYEQLDTENILRNFPRIRPELAARLGRANTHRRHYLSNRRAAYNEHGLEGQNWSVASFTATIRDAEFPRWMINYDDRSVTCPCCFKLFSFDDQSWQYVALNPVGVHELINRQHIYDELRPFVCLEDDCHNGDAQYESIGQWVGHMRQHHWQTWTCGLCLDIFDKSILLETHLEKEHALVETSEVDDLVSSGEGSKAPDNPTMCPFCGEILEGLETYGFHVGHHQGQVALSILEPQKQKASSTRDDNKPHAPDDRFSLQDSKRARKVWTAYTPESNVESSSEPSPGLGATPKSDTQTASRELSPVLQSTSYPQSTFSDASVESRSRRSSSGEGEI